DRVRPGRLHAEESVRRRQTEIRTDGGGPARPVSGVGAGADSERVGGTFRWGRTRGDPACRAGSPGPLLSGCRTRSGPDWRRSGKGTGRPELERMAGPVAKPS